VISTPPGAEVVRSDGKILGSTPWQLERPAGPGETSVTLRHAERQDMTIVLSHNTDVKTEVNLLLLPTPEPPLENEKPRKSRARPAAKKSEDNDVKLLD